MQAHIWQLNFALKPEALAELKHELKVNEQVLRFVVVKQPLYKYSLPQLLERAHGDNTTEDL